MSFISKISASLSIACDIKPGGALYQCLCWASKRSHTWGKCVTCCGLLLSPIASSINPHERQELALEGCTFHTFLPTFKYGTRLIVWANQILPNYLHIPSWKIHWWNPVTDDCVYHRNPVKATYHLMNLLHEKELIIQYNNNGQHYNYFDCLQDVCLKGRPLKVEKHGKIQRTNADNFTAR